MITTDIWLRHSTVLWAIIYTAGDKLHQLQKATPLSPVQYRIEQPVSPKLLQFELALLIGDNASIASVLP